MHKILFLFLLYTGTFYVFSVYHIQKANSPLGLTGIRHFQTILYSSALIFADFLLTIVWGDGDCIQY